jgi:rod shape-determining protein MreD
VYKINRFQIYLILTIAFFLHLTVLNHVKIYGAKPDLLLACVVFFGLFLGSSAGLESGILAGFFCDVFALDFFGINILSYAITGLAAGILATKVFRESKKIGFAAVFFFTAFSMSLHFIVVSALSRSLNLTYPEFFYSSILPAGIYTALVSVPIFVKLIDLYDLKESQGLL